MVPGEEWPFMPEGYRSLGQSDPLGPRPFELESPSGGGFLPTYPGTQLEFAARAWPLCRWCRVLVRLHLWRLRDRHIDRRHPQHPLVVLPRLGTPIRPPSRSYGGRVHDVHGGPGRGWPPCWCGYDPDR